MVIKSFTRFLKEAHNIQTTDDLKKKVTAVLGHDKFKDKTKTSFQVLVDGVNRMAVMKQIESIFSSIGAKYDPNKGSSSIGAVVIGKFSIGVAPLSSQGKKSAGLDNEDTLLLQLNNFLRDGPLHVEFITGNKSFRVEDVKHAEEVGRYTSGRRKSDVNLVTMGGLKVPISVKKDNAEMWESSDSYYSKKAKDVIDEQVRAGKVKLEGIAIKKVIPNIAVKASTKETADTVFGSDILKNKGAVLYKTFYSSDFSINVSGDTITVKVSEIYRTVAEVERGGHAVYFLIRNDASRKWSKIYPGIRVLAVGKSRISRNVLVV
jgi:hypothetical protein